VLLGHVVSFPFPVGPGVAASAVTGFRYCSRLAKAAATVGPHEPGH
jgi:hypothetical protein